jgi:hypothetical protein
VNLTRATEDGGAELPAAKGVVESAEGVALEVRVGDDPGNAEPPKVSFTAADPPQNDQRVPTAPPIIAPPALVQPAIAPQPVVAPSLSPSVTAPPQPPQPVIAPLGLSAGPAQQPATSHGGPTVQAMLTSPWNQAQGTQTPRTNPNSRQQMERQLAYWKLRAQALEMYAESMQLRSQANEESRRLPEWELVELRAKVLDSRAEKVLADGYIETLKEELEALREPSPETQHENNQTENRASPAASGKQHGQHDLIKQAMALAEAAKARIKDDADLQKVEAAEQAIDEKLRALSNQLEMIEKSKVAELGDLSTQFNRLQDQLTQHLPRATVVKPQRADSQVHPGTRLEIHALETVPEHPIHGSFVVEPMGTVALGPYYGRVVVAGKSILEAEHAILEHLKKILDNPKVQVTIIGSDAQESDIWYSLTPAQPEQR